MTKKLNAAVKSVAVALTTVAALAVAVPAVGAAFTTPVGAAASLLADPIGWGTSNSAPAGGTVVSAGAQEDPIGW